MMEEEGCTNSSSDSTLFCPCNATQPDKEMVFGISLGFGIASLLGVLAIIGHAVAKRLYFSSEVRSLVHLSIATAGFCTCLIILSSFYITGTSRNYVENAAIYVITLEEIFYLISFFLTANYTIVVYVKLRDKLNLLEEHAALETQRTTRRIIRLSYEISWILPPLLLVPVTVAVVTRPVTFKLCLLCPSVLYYPSKNGTAFDNDFLKNFGFILVIASYCIVVVIILVFFTLSWRICSRILNRRSTEVCDNTLVRWLRMRMSLYILGFFYCWTQTFVIAILILVGGPQKLKSCAVLFYVWAVTAPCQGLVLAIIYFYSIFYQTTQPQFRRGKRPFGSRIYRFYGTGSQRSRYPSIPKVRTPSPSLSDGSQVGDTNANMANVGTLSPPTISSLGNKKKPRSPSFLGLLKNQENELTEGNED